MIYYLLVITNEGWILLIETIFGSNALNVSANKIQLG